MIETLLPLALTIAGITAYAFFVFRFYRFLSRRDVFTLNLPKAFSIVLYLLLYLLVYPVCVFLWFAVLTALLYVVSSDQLETIMLISMGVVGAVRVSCYYSEQLAADIARIVPLGLLSFMLVDSTLFVGSVQESIQYAEALWANFDLVQWETLLYYLGAVIGLEFALRLLTLSFRGSDTRTD
ncbi:MAG: hypothetical protein F4Y49_03620 [Dehalococcoidia bacterium]|nr:hypothetical protein [Dehalococcoidia bacterium]